jgi:hypothetical protein
VTTGSSARPSTDHANVTGPERGRRRSAAPRSSAGAFPTPRAQEAEIRRGSSRFPVPRARSLGGEVDRVEGELRRRPVQRNGRRVHRQVGDPQV